MRSKYLAAIWATLHEPRVITLLMVVCYALTGTMGVSILVGAGKITYWALSILTGSLLVLSGLIGMPTAWKGEWTIERAAAILAAGGYLSYMLVIFDYNRKYDLVLPFELVALSTMMVLFMLARFARVCQASFAPGRGPVDPMDKLRAEEVIVADTIRQQSKEWAKQQIANAKSQETDSGD